MRKSWALIGVPILLGALLSVPHLALGAGGHQGAGKAKTQHILLLSNNPNDGAPSVIIARGPIHAQGTDKPISNHKDLFKFPNGTLTIRHSATGHHNTSDKKTCYFTHAEHGVYKVIGGTGAYAGASGSGKYHLLVQFVACPHHKPRFVAVEVHAAGPLTL